MKKLWWNIKDWWTGGPFDYPVYKRVWMRFQVWFADIFSRRCQHEGCHNRAFECFCGHDEIDTEWFCADHASEHGYCYICGQFWGGVSTFEFNHAGLCENCYDEEDEDNED